LLDEVSQQSIKLAEGRMVSRWATSQEMKTFWGAERQPQKDQGVLSTNGAQSINCSGEVSK